MPSESSDTKPTPDKAPTTAEPDRPTPKHIFLGQEGWIPSFVFLHDNIHIVSGSSDGTMCKWDCNTGLLVGEPWEDEGKNIFALALSPNGKTIACGRVDGVQMWNTDGEMSKGIWMGHSDYVRSVSWSPMGGYIASGSYDGTILIRKAGSGEVEVGPIETKQDKVWSLAYSPSGDKIASGGYNGTIYIWDSNTGELLVDPIKDLGSTVDSVVWSSDSSTLYSASDSFARVFDSISGTELHRFEHNRSLYSVALSPKHNVLACVGNGNITQLWDTESHQTLCQSLNGTDDDRLTLCCVSFSRDGRYLAYSGDDRKITLWMVQDIAPELVFPSLSYLEVDATNPFALSGNDDMGEDRDNIYDGFLRPSEPSRPSQRPSPSSTWRLWNVLIPLQSRTNHSLFGRRTGSQPVTVSAARPRKLYWVPPRRVLPKDQNAEVKDNNANSARVGQSCLAAAQHPSAAAPCASPQEPQHLQAQHVTRPAQERELDYNCWQSFWAAVCCISGVQHTAS